MPMSSGGFTPMRPPTTMPPVPAQFMPHPGMPHIPHHGMRMPMPPPGMQFQQGMPPMGIPHGFVPPPPPPLSDDSGPPNKRPREETLESEEQWLQKVSGQINVKLNTPQSDEWNLTGQTYDIQLDITSTVWIIPP